MKWFLPILLMMALCPHLNGLVFAQAPSPALVYPIIPKVGGVVPLPDGAEQPRAGAKVICDITANAKPDELNKGVERVARLLNLYGSVGLKATDVRVALVFHGEATKSALSNEAYKARFGESKNPNLETIQALKSSGVEIYVCGQALAYKGFAASEVAGEVKVASAALTVIINKQMEGYSYLPAH